MRDVCCRATARVRYHQREQAATVTVLGDGHVHLVFDEPQQQRLRLVICSMGGCDPVYPLFAQPRKAGVPQAARPVLAGMFRWTANLFGQF